MNGLEETRKKRFQYLKTLHDAAHGSSTVIFSMFQLGEKLGFGRDESANIVEYLAGENLVKCVTIDGGISITHYGRKEIERALSAPDKPTTYFPAVNILHIESMVGSQVQQGTHHSIQKMALAQNQLDAIRGFMTLLKTRLTDLPLDADKRSETDAEITTVQAQLQSSRPKPGIIHECLQSIRTILEGAAGDLVASGLLQQLTHIIATFSQ